MTATAELAIRMRRASFNTALVDRDLQAIAPLLAPDVVLVAGTDSAVIVGRKAQLAAWKREFAAGQTTYRRSPDTVVVSAVEPIAFEHGQWQGVAAAGDAVVARGAYTAKWRCISDAWTIEAELFLTTG